MAADGEAERRRDFRAWVRTHHPDAGGDPAVFAAGLAARREGQARPARGRAPEVTVYRAHRGLWRVRRWWRRRTR